MADYPKPQPPYEGHSDLYFATERQIRSGLVLAGYDRGELTLAPACVQFRGMDVQVDCTGVTGISLVRKAFPWAVVLAVGLAAAVGVYLLSPVPFTWRQPLPFILLFILLAVSAKYMNETWIEIVYSKQGQIHRAYFMRQSALPGLSARRTRTLYHDLCKAVLPAATPDPAESLPGPNGGMTR